MPDKKKTQAVTYVDGHGKEHDALVSAVNVRNPGYLSLVYIDPNADEADNVRKLWDIPHRTMATAETNPNLPQYDVNCWKDAAEPHAKLPEDHPTFDHPFAQPEKTATGDVISKARPRFSAAVHDHMATSLRMAAGARVDPDSDAARVAQQGHSAGAAQQEAPPMPAPVVSDEEAEKLAAELERELRDGGVAIPGLPGPSAADLDAVVAEQRAAEATSGAADLGKGAGEVPVQAQTPDYKDLRDQIDDHASTFYGPHACPGGCDQLVIRRAVEQGGEIYSERDPNLGPPRYELHFCKPAEKPFND